MTMVSECTKTLVTANGQFEKCEAMHFNSEFCIVSPIGDIVEFIQLELRNDFEPLLVTYTDLQ